LADILTNDDYTIIVVHMWKYKKLTMLVGTTNAIDNQLNGSAAKSASRDHADNNYTM